MASNIPTSLKSGDLGRIALRAAQVEKAKPVIAYWCHYYIVEKVIERGLHNTDDEIKQYTSDLVDKLLRFKNENPDNDTLLDNTAASAYVEEFGLEVFNRADAAMRANKVTKQTADTFQAAATFLELLQVWASLEPEIAAKVKFAKYHALRIVKAVRNGEDPNATNPPPAEETSEPTIDPNDVEVKAFDESIAQQTARSRQPSVDEVSDEDDRVPRQMAHQSLLDESRHPSRPSSIPPGFSPPVPTLPSAASHALESAHADDADTEPQTTLNLPSTPDHLGPPSTLNLPDTPATTSLSSSPPRPSMPFNAFPPPPAIPPSSPPFSTLDPNSFYQPHRSPSAKVQPSHESTLRGPSTSQHHAGAPAPAPRPMQSAARASATAPPPSNTEAPPVDDQAIVLAQKHARWAVSALTFDDVNTAVKELKISLKYLGVE